MPKADLSIHSNQFPRTVSWNGLRVREDVLYTNAEGEESERSRKRAEDALEKLKDVLPSVLEPEETILYVVRNCQAPMSSLEQLTLGWYAYRITAATLVFTNLRLLHFSVKANGTWKRGLRAVRWGDVAEAKTRGWLNRMLELRYADGKKESYWRLRRGDSKKIKVLLAALLPASRGEMTSARRIVSLCPDCRTALAAGVYQCSPCGLTFKDEKTLLWRALLPGGGYLYTEIWFLGAIGFLAEGILLLWALTYVLMATGTIAPLQDPGQPIPNREAFWIAAGFVGFLLALEKLIAYHHSRRVVRSFLPLKRPGQA